MKIEVEKLTKSFGKLIAVNDVSFTINSGETFALLGPNGSGKSTTLKCLAGLMLPTSGRISVSGFDVWKQAREARRLMSYLPQRVSFHDSLTAHEVMEFYCRLRKMPAQRIDEVLHGSSFNFNGFANRPVSELSGGMVQRLGLAVACLPDTPVLVLDEPTISLDPEGAIRFREFLKSLKRQGKTILLSTHVLADVEQLADRVAILVGGKLAAIESIESLREGIMRTSKMRVVLTNPGERWLQVALWAGAEEVALEGDSLLIASPLRSRLEILRDLESAGAIIARFTTSESSLEDVYLSYTHKEKVDDKKSQ